MVLCFGNLKLSLFLFTVLGLGIGLCGLASDEEPLDGSLLFIWDMVGSSSSKSGTQLGPATGLPGLGGGNAGHELSFTARRPPLDLWMLWHIEERPGGLAICGSLGRAGSTGGMAGGVAMCGSLGDLTGAGSTGDRPGGDGDRLMLKTTVSSWAVKMSAILKSVWQPTDVEVDAADFLILWCDRLGTWGGTVNTMF